MGSVGVVNTADPLVVETIRFLPFRQEIGGEYVTAGLAVMLPDDLVPLGVRYVRLTQDELDAYETAGSRLSGLKARLNTENMVVRAWLDEKFPGWKFREREPVDAPGAVMTVQERESRVTTDGPKHAAFRDSLESGYLTVPVANLRNVKMVGELSQMAQRNGGLVIHLVAGPPTRKKKFSE